MTNFSIVVVSCGNLKLTIPCLKNILSFTHNLAQIILVDNGSNNYCKSKLFSFCENFSIKFLSLESNFGPGIGRLKGLELATNEYVAFVDDDIIVTESWDIPLLKKITNDNSVGQVSSIMAESHLSHPFFLGKNLRQIWDSPEIGVNVDKAIDYFMCSKSHAEFIYELNKANYLLEYEKVVTPPDAIGGGCFMVRKSLLERIGGVSNPNFLSYGNEDIDLSWRIGIAGATIYRSNYSYVHHFRHGGSEFLYSREQRKSLLKSSNEYFIEKWWKEIQNHVPVECSAAWMKERKNWFLVMIQDQINKKRKL